MRFVEGVWHRLRAPLRPVRAGEDLDDEIACHLDLHIADNIRAGMPPGDARRLALAKLGGINAMHEARRDMRMFAALDTLWRDVRYALRSWRREPVVALVAVASLALGIGTNTAVFSLIDRVMLRSIPVHEPDRLALLSPGATSIGWTYPAWNQLQGYESLTAGLAAWSWPPTPSNAISVDGYTTRAQVAMVSGSFFEVLGIHAALGRMLDQHDDRLASVVTDAAAIISDRYWRSRFNATPGIVGRLISIDRQNFTIVGVTPSGFDGVFVGTSFDVAVPLAAEHLLGGESSRLEAHSSWWLQVLVRLPPGAEEQTVVHALRGIQPQIRELTRPDGPGHEEHLTQPFTLAPLAGGHLRSSYGMPLGLSMASVALVLLIACANLAGLLLTRTDARRHELGLRLALGASRRRLATQMFVEIHLLVGVGAMLALLIAPWVCRFLVWQIQTINMPVVLDVDADARMVAFALLVTLLTTVLIGLGPAVYATRTVWGAPPSGSAGIQARRTDARAAFTLVFLQGALSFVVIAGAGLFLRSLDSLLGNVKGLDVDRVLIARVYVAPGTLDATSEVLLFDELHRAAATVPGVSTAALSTITPAQAAVSVGPIAAAGGVLVDRPARQRNAFLNAIGPGFFETYGTTLLAGRGFTSADTSSAERVAIVNSAFVRQFLAGRDDIVGLPVVRGRSIDAGLEFTIVGVVEDATYIGPREATGLPILYVPLAQAEPHAAHGFPHVSVRVTGGDASRFIGPLGEALTRVSPFVTVDVHTLDWQVRSAITRERLLALLSGALASLVLLLAGIGLYGTTAYSVIQRRREIGIRTALGATPAAIVRLAAARVVGTLVLGVFAGAILALWAGQFVESLLFGVASTDVITYLLTAALLLFTGVTAGVLPAWRASRTSPAAVLREE